MRKTSKISIDVYDADGVLCESIGGPMDFEDARSRCWRSCATMGSR